MLGKHSNEAYMMKQMKLEKRQLEDIIKRKDREIKDIKTECASEFKRISDLCFCNSYNGELDERKKLSVIEKIAIDNYSALVTGLVIDKDMPQKAKIIELTTTLIEISSNIN